MVRFLWPHLLWLGAALPLLVAAYLFVVRRRSRAALRFASIGLAREAMHGRAALRRHVPPLLVLAALAATVLALARPAAVVPLTSLQDTIILAIDCSGSMRASDVPPSRLAAAQAAARAFIAEQPAHTRIGIVEFASMASLVQPPTQRREDLERTIERLYPQGATALGAAIFTAVKAVFPEAEVDLADSDSYWHGAALAAQPGSYKSAAVIVLADGENSSGPDPLAAARFAARHGLRIYTVGFGTGSGEVAPYAGGSVSMRVSLDEPMLRYIAESTGGEYLRAADAAELAAVYRSLHADTILELKYTELTAVLCAVALAVLVFAAAASLAWSHRAA
jgi:Ca-activated chloride channel family protein